MHTIPEDSQKAPAAHTPCGPLPAHPTTRGAARAFPLVSKRRTWHARCSTRYLSSRSPMKTLRPQKRLRAYVSRYTLRSGMSRGAAAAKFPLRLMSLLAFPSGVPSSQARHSRRGNTPKEALIPLFEASSSPTPSGSPVPAHLMDRAHTGAAHRQPLHSGASANSSLRPHAASTHIPH